MRFKLLAGAAVAIFAVLQIVRNGVVQDKEPEKFGSLVWPHHPEVLRAVAMRKVGEAAGAGQRPSETTMEAFRTLATRAPRAPEPFLVQAALAVKDGNNSRAQRLLSHALRRDPRSTAARFLLADLFLNNGRAAEGLRELTLMARVMPSSSVHLAGAFQQFARSGGTAAHLRQLFAINPALENQILSTLAEDPANADLIVAAASRRTTEGDPITPAWQEKLLSALVARQEYHKAYQIWRRLAEIPRSGTPGLFNPNYRATPVPAPFNWAFTTSGAGVAKGDNGALHVIHYGAANASLAKQLLLLAPGTYNLTTTITGSAPQEGQLIWNIICLPAGERVLVAAVAADGGTLRARFNIPASSCGAQQLELMGNAMEPVSMADVRIGPLNLERVPR